MTKEKKVTYKSVVEYYVERYAVDAVREKLNAEGVDRISIGTYGTTIMTQGKNMGDPITWEVFVHVLLPGWAANGKTRNRKIYAVYGIANTHGCHHDRIVDTDFI